MNAVQALSDVAPPALCDAPWTGPAVTVDGYLTPCCVMWDPATLGYINIADISVEAAFALPSFQRFLAGYLQRAPGFCGGCQNNARPVAESFVPLLQHPSERAEAGHRRARPEAHDRKGADAQRSVSAIVAAKTSCLIESAVTPNM